MAHRELPPDARLAAWVASLRFSWDEDAASARRVHRIVPDGCVDLLVSVPVASGEIQSDVFGVKSKPRRVGGDGPRENVALHFHPGTASRFLGVAAHELVDRCVDLGSLWGSRGAELAERIADAPDRAARGRLLEAGLLARLDDAGAGHSPGRALVDAAIARIRQARGRRPIRDLATELAVGERRLERLFRDEVGLPPKFFSRIVRLEAALAALRAGGEPASVALACGYSDQPHLLRDFRALTGTSPTAWFAEAGVGFVQAGSCDAA